MTRSSSPATAAPLAALLLAPLMSRSAIAHHSFATFDNTKIVKLTGTVKTFEWTNPHSWIWLVVADDKGGEQVWGLEGTAPGELTRHGWNRHSINPGDKIMVEIHPLRDGRAGGSYSRVTFVDGHELDAGGPGPGSAAEK